MLFELCPGRGKAITDLVIVPGVVNWKYHVNIHGTFSICYPRNAVLSMLHVFLLNIGGWLLLRPANCTRRSIRLLQTFRYVVLVCVNMGSCRYPAQYESEVMISQSYPACSVGVGGAVSPLS